MQHSRAKPQAFVVNDSIYVLSRNKVSEKYLLKENKWKPFHASSLTDGPAALLYE
jgi:hypothetical protein